MWVLLGILRRLIPAGAEVLAVAVAWRQARAEERLDLSASVVQAKRIHSFRPQSLCQHQVPFIYSQIRLYPSCGSTALPDGLN